MRFINESSAFNEQWTLPEKAQAALVHQVADHTVGKESNLNGEYNREEKKVKVNREVKKVKVTSESDK